MSETPPSARSITKFFDSPLSPALAALRSRALPFALGSAVVLGPQITAISYRSTAFLVLGLLASTVGNAWYVFSSFLLLSRAALEYASVPIPLAADLTFIVVAGVLVGVASQSWAKRWESYLRVLNGTGYILILGLLTGAIYIVAVAQLPADVPSRNTEGFRLSPGWANSLRQRKVPVPLPLGDATKRVQGELRQLHSGNELLRVDSRMAAAYYLFNELDRFALEAPVEELVKRPWSDVILLGSVRDVEPLNLYSYGSEVTLIADRVLTGLINFSLKRRGGVDPVFVPYWQV